MPKSLKISLILSGASALILLGLFYIPSPSVAQTTVWACTERVVVNDGAMPNEAYCFAGELRTGNGWCTSGGGEKLLSPNTGYAVGENGWACPRPSGWSYTPRAGVNCCPKFSCGGSFTDSRDSNVYPTVLIGRQCWVAKNLDYDGGVNGCKTKTWTNSTDMGWCGYYTGGPFANEGLLYQWSAAMNGSTSAGAQGICPSGWHIPTDAEQYTLENSLTDTGQSCNASRRVGYVPDNGWSCSAAGTKLKSGGSSGFNALMTGYRANGGAFSSRSSQGWFWSSDNTWLREFSQATYLEGQDASKNYQVGRRSTADLSGAGNSFPVRCLRDILIPTAPINITAVRGDAQVTVTFTVPASNGGSAITGYTVISSPIGGVDANAETTAGITNNTGNRIITNLNNGTPYTFTVTATNGAGTSPASLPSVAVTPYGVPRIPTNVTATAGNQQIVLNWIEPNNGGIGISNYIIYKSTISEDYTSGSSVNVGIGQVTGTGIGTTDSAYIDTDVLSGTTYYYKIAAGNNIGLGMKSAQVSATLSASATDPFYRHVKFSKVTYTGATPLPPVKFICSPFVANIGGVAVPTDQLTAPENINWQGKHTTKLEAVTETIKSLEKCLKDNGNGYGQFYYNQGNNPSFYGYNWPGYGCSIYGREIIKAWANGNIIESENNTPPYYFYNGIARQVNYDSLDYAYNPNNLYYYTSCTKGIIPAVVNLRTTSCSNATSLDPAVAGGCSVLTAIVPTSQGPYGIDLKVAGPDGLVSDGPIPVDPGSNVNLSWSTTNSAANSAITTCVASGDWSGNKTSYSSGPETLNVTPANVPAYSYYQGIDFGTPGLRSDCISGAEGCSSKPHFYCSPWVNASGVFIDKPSSGTHINYQGNYTTQAEAVDASKASLLTCLGTSSNYKNLLKTDFNTGIYRGVVNPEDAYHCTLGGSWLDFASHWLYNGNLTGIFSGPYIDNQCHYSGAFELFKISTNTSNKVVYMSSYDCALGSGGYKPTINGCSSIVNQQVSLFQKVTVPAVDNSIANTRPSRTYTLTCDYFGGKLSDSVVVNINNTNPPVITQLTATNSKIVGSNLIGNTVGWTTVTSNATKSAVLKTQVYRYDSCVSDKTEDQISNDIKNNVVDEINVTPSSTGFIDTIIKSGYEYTYAVRAENGYGPGLFRLSGCTDIILATPQLFTLTTSTEGGFNLATRVNIQRIPDAADANPYNLACDNSSINILDSGKTLKVSCAINSDTPVGKWKIQIFNSQGRLISEAPTNVSLTIKTADNTSRPSAISFSPTELSAVNGVINIASIGGKDIGDLAYVKLVSNNDIAGKPREIICNTLLNRIGSDNVGGSTFGEVSCSTKDLGFDMTLSAGWKVVVVNNVRSNGLSSDPSSTSVSLSCNPTANCTDKVCGDNLCGGTCGPATKSCSVSNYYRTCSGTGTQTCNESSGQYNIACSVTSSDPRIGTCVGKVCGPTLCGSFCSNGVVVPTNTSSQACSVSFGNCVVVGIKTCNSAGTGHSGCKNTNGTALVDPRSAACSGKTCGNDTCGGNCPPNSCVSPQTCGGGGTTGVCADVRL